MRIMLAAWLCAVLFASATRVEAHPHVFVDAKAEIVYDEAKRIAAVRHVWVFDDAFSSMAVMGLDVDGDGALTREELQPLAKINVESLHEYKFFTFLEHGKKNIAFAEPRDYWLEYDGSKLTLHFSLPLQAPLTANAFVLEVYDPEYFVAFQLDAQDPVKLAGAAQGCRHAIERPTELDAGTAMLLSQIPAEIRELPDDLSSMTISLANRITVTCG